MITNADITIYHRYVDPDTRMDAYDRHTVSKVLWEECKAVNIIKSGMEDSDAFRIYIPLAHMDNAIIAPGDTVIRGLRKDELSQVLTLAELKKRYPSFVVTSVDKKDFGSPAMHHFEIGGK